MINLNSLLRLYYIKGNFTFTRKQLKKLTYQNYFLKKIITITI